MTFHLQEFAGRPTLSYRAGPAAGPPLLLLHGVGRSSEDYASLAAELSVRSQVHALDLRGHGRSGRGHSYLVTDYTRDVVDLVTFLFKSEPVTLVGHSAGAMVSLAVAAERPENVRALILEEPPFHTMGREIDRTPWKSLFIGMREVARGGGTREEKVKQLAQVPITSADGKAATRLGELRTRLSLEASAGFLESVDPEVFTPIIEGRWLDGYDHRALLARVECPVLLLQGDSAAGAALTDEDALLVASTVPRCQREKFPGLGHMIHGENPGRMLRAIDEFLLGLGTDVAGSPEPFLPIPRPDPPGRRRALL